MRKRNKLYFLRTSNELILFQSINTNYYSYPSQQTVTQNIHVGLCGSEYLI